MLVWSGARTEKSLFINNPTAGPIFLYMAPDLGMPSLKIPTIYSLRDLYLKQELSKLNLHFLYECRKRKSLPSGLSVSFNLSHKPTNFSLLERIENILNEASSKILDVIAEDLDTGILMLSSDLERTRNNLNETFGKDHVDQTFGTLKQKCEDQLQHKTLAQEKKLLSLKSHSIDHTKPFEGSVRICASKYTTSTSKFWNKKRRHRLNRSKKCRTVKAPQSNPKSQVSQPASCSQFDPIVLSKNVNLTEDQKSICRLSDKFAPTPTSPIDVSDQFIGTNAWAERLRWHYFFEKNPTTSPENDIEEDKEDGFVKNPWYIPTSKQAPRTNHALELFIQTCTNDFIDPKNRRRIRDNLTEEQRKALKELKLLPNTHNAACCYADKSGATVITDLTEDDQKIKTDLSDPNHYDLLDSNPTSEVIKKIDSFVNKWSHKVSFSEEMQLFVKPSNNSHPGNCKPLIKTHKPEPYPTRLLLSGCGTPIQPLSKFVQSNISHLPSELPHKVIDTKEFLCKIEDVNNVCAPLPDTACLATCDVVSLYPNVNNDMGVPATKKLLQSNPSPHGVPTECVLDALKLSLNNNACMYETENEVIIAKPNKGTAMGPSHACDYVDVFMSELDKTVVNSSPVPLITSTLPPEIQEQYTPLNWSRFRDDGFTILLSENDVPPFFDFLQTLHPPNIKWTLDHGQTANYLDVKLSIKDGKITTDIYSKHNHSYLPPTSCHSPAVFKGLIQGMGVRLRMIVSEDDTLETRINEYSDHLEKSGWNRALAKERLIEGATKRRSEILNKPRCSKPKKLAWVTTYDPRTPSKSSIIKKNLHLLHADPENSTIFPPNLIIGADKKRPNLAQLYKPTVPKRWPNHGPHNEPGFFVCSKKCDTCKHSKIVKAFTSPWDSRKWYVRQHITCTTPNVIYILSCKIHRNFWYVGSAEDLKARWRGHKSDINLKNKRKCLAAAHFSSGDHPNDRELPFAEIFAIESVGNKELLGQKETFWQCNTGSIFVGNNRRIDITKQIHSHNRVHYK